MKTEKQKFIDYLKNEGFTVSPILHTLRLIPHYRKIPDSDHTLISNIGCCLFSGCDTKNGDLGCVTFYYGGTVRYKYRRQSGGCELLKKIIVPKTAKEAIGVYEQWRAQSAYTLSTWRTVI